MASIRAIAARQAARTRGHRLGLAGYAGVSATGDRSSNTTCLIDCQRSSGSFSRHRRTNRSSQAGVNGFTDIAVRQLPHSAFAGIEPTQPRGNLGRNTFRKDGVANVKLGLSRIWNLAGDQSLMFRVESPNLFNTPQFAEPDHNAASLNFGEITNTLNDEGAFRFTLQFSF